ncbi:helix-turn-helix domain-containing protein [Vibrio parahaemolyticus]|uniref:helix-turn-helix domain-containing protein n=1 Tax=Vibrio parahaemolyticus TaxID=670 RepID=UPI00084BC0A3|nr:helix-turn-helix domain-containing protein [Vibrio parahaemolyticus]EJC1211273.1 helix-turn-helix domain-containing protein [Vibrio parahaemolyticus]EJG0937109.1 helix-turn-helix domain-containing protein [Vibrio parahaemolyticus]MCS0116753.1 helix-turn-helix domain-containing protein [Vibrio parahaemolyticus]ODY87408.1 chromosome partitioning protein ParA [Vibrio parahaemolyticus]HAS6759939.1 chromosome partitioning protein ParA [Vibrio parahaemolyticus]
MSTEKILPFDYIKGDKFTEVLKEVTGCRTFLDMSELFDVPKATFSAWKLHERTSHELIVRLHLAKGIPIKKLALGIDEEETASSQAPFYSSHAPAQYTSPQRGTVILESFCLANGQLIDTGEVPYAVRRINSFGLNPTTLIEVETNEAIFLVDKGDRDAVSGKYLIDVDGHLSINHIQRLPGKKLAIAFGETTMEVSEHDITVMGRVAVTSKKD